MYVYRPHLPVATRRAFIDVACILVVHDQTEVQGRDLGWFLYKCIFLLLRLLFKQVADGRLALRRLFWGVQLGEEESRRIYFQSSPEQVRKPLPTTHHSERY